MLANPQGIQTIQQVACDFDTIALFEKACRQLLNKKLIYHSRSDISPIAVVLVLQVEIDITSNSNYYSHQ